MTAHRDAIYAGVLALALALEAFLFWRSRAPLTRCRLRP